MDKRFIWVLVMIFGIGFSSIFIDFNKGRSEEKKVIVEQVLEDSVEGEVIIENTESTPNLLLEKVETQPEQYNDKQMYFENIEILYEYFNYEEIEEIKEAARIYIQENISNDILDSRIIAESLTLGWDNINFKIEVLNNKKITVTVFKNEDNTIKKIELS